MTTQFTNPPPSATKATTPEELLRDLYQPIEVDINTTYNFPSTEESKTVSLDTQEPSIAEKWQATLAEHAELSQREIAFNVLPSEKVASAQAALQDAYATLRSSVQELAAELRESINDNYGEIALDAAAKGKAIHGSVFKASQTLENGDYGKFVKNAFAAADALEAAVSSETLVTRESNIHSVNELNILFDNQVALTRSLSKTIPSIDLLIKPIDALSSARKELSKIGDLHSQGEMHSLTDAQNEHLTYQCMADQVRINIAELQSKHTQNLAVVADCIENSNYLPEDKFQLENTFETANSLLKQIESLAPEVKASIPQEELENALQTLQAIEEITTKGLESLVEIEELTESASVLDDVVAVEEQSNPEDSGIIDNPDGSTIVMSGSSTHLKLPKPETSAEIAPTANAPRIEIAPGKDLRRAVSADEVISREFDELDKTYSAIQGKTADKIDKIAEALYEYEAAEAATREAKEALIVKQESERAALKNLGQQGESLKNAIAVATASYQEKLETIQDQYYRHENEGENFFDDEVSAKNELDNFKKEGPSGWRKAKLANFDFKHPIKSITKLTRSYRRELEAYDKKWMDIRLNNRNDLRQEGDQTGRIVAQLKRANPEVDADAAFQLLEKYSPQVASTYKRGLDLATKQLEVAQERLRKAQLDVNSWEAECEAKASQLVNARKKLTRSGGVHTSLGEVHSRFGGGTFRYSNDIPQVVRDSVISTSLLKQIQNGEIGRIPTFDNLQSSLQAEENVKVEDNFITLTRGAYEIRISNYAPGRSLVRFFNARTGEPLKKTEGDGDRPAQAVALNHKVEELAELFLREPVKALQRVRFAAPINREGEVVTVAKYDDYLGRQGSPTPRPTETRQKPQRAFTPAFIAEAVKEVIVEEEAEEPNQVYPEGALDEAVDDGDEPTRIIRFPTSR